MQFKKSFHTIDTHVAGEAFRIITHSPITLKGDDIHYKNTVLQTNFSNEKDLLLNEPRGHRGMHGCIVLPSSLADIGLLFFHHDYVCNFKYEGVIATVTALLETGYLSRTVDDVYKVETVNGVVIVRAMIQNNNVTSLHVESNQSAIIESHSDYQIVQIDNSRNYALFKLPETIPSIELKHLATLEDLGRQLRAKLLKTNVAYDGIVLMEDTEETNTVCSITFEKDGYILRSPGIDSTMTLMHSISRKNRNLNEFINKSIFESVIIAKKLPNYNYSIETKAFLTGTHQFIFDEDDPLKDGFLLT